MGFPMAQGGERDRPEGWKRGGRKDGGPALKQAGGHHYRGAIVLALSLSRPFLMRAPVGGGAGRHGNRGVGGGPGWGD